MFALEYSLHILLQLRFFRLKYDASIFEIMEFESTYFTRIFRYLLLGDVLIFSVNLSCKRIKFCNPFFFNKNLIANVIQLSVMDRLGKQGLITTLTEILKGYSYKI